MALAAAAISAAQTIEVYSEFQRIDPFGAVVAADRGLQSREILSPALPRNGHVSFHVAISVPPKESYFLYAATNPVDACRLTLYKEHFVKTRDGWVPDVLTELHRLPDFGTMPDPEDSVEGQTTRVYLLDLWVPPGAEIRRVRVELQLKVADWTVRPMELRVMRAQIPGIGTTKTPAPLPGVENGADAFAGTALRDFRAGLPLLVEESPKTVRAVIRRNAIQDVMLVRAPEDLMTRALDLFRANFAGMPRMLGAEWYLRLRDYLFVQ